MTTSKITITVSVLTYQLLSQILSDDLHHVNQLHTLQSQTHLVLDPLSTMEMDCLAQMNMIHPQSSYCYFHQLLYHLCRLLMSLCADMLVFEMPDFLGENEHTMMTSTWTKCVILQTPLEWGLCICMSTVTQ